MFRKLPDNWAQNKEHKMITECANQISSNHYFYRQKTNLDQIITFKNPNLDQIITFKNPKLGPDNNFTAYIYMYIYVHT